MNRRFPLLAAALAVAATLGLATPPGAMSSTPPEAAPDTRIDATPAVADLGVERDRSPGVTCTVTCIGLDGGPVPCGLADTFVCTDTYTTLQEARVNIRIDAAEVTALADAWRQAPEVVMEELEAAVLEGSLLVEREVRERTPIGVGGGGGLAGSISARDPRRLADRVIGEVGTSLRYAAPVELGRRAGKPPPPLDPIIDWVRQKLGVPEADVQRAAQAVRWHIHRHGTQGAHMFRDGAAGAAPGVRAAYTAAAGRIAARLAERAAPGAAPA